MQLYYNNTSMMDFCVTPMTEATVNPQNLSCENGNGSLQMDIFQSGTRGECIRTPPNTIRPPSLMTNYSPEEMSRSSISPDSSFMSSGIWTPPSSTGSFACSRNSSQQSFVQETPASNDGDWGHHTDGNESTISELCFMDRFQLYTKKSRERAQADINMSAYMPDPRAEIAHPSFPYHALPAYQQSEPAIPRTCSTNVNLGEPILPQQLRSTRSQVSVAATLPTSTLDGQHIGHIKRESGLGCYDSLLHRSQIAASLPGGCSRRRGAQRRSKGGPQPTKYEPSVDYIKYGDEDIPVGKASKKGLHKCEWDGCEASFDRREHKERHCNNVHKEKKDRWQCPFLCDIRSKKTGEKGIEGRHDNLTTHLKNCHCRPTERDQKPGASKGGKIRDRKTMLQWLESINNPESRRYWLEYFKMEQDPGDDALLRKIRDRDWRFVKMLSKEGLSYYDVEEKKNKKGEPPLESPKKPSETHYWKTIGWNVGYAIETLVIDIADEYNGADRNTATLWSRDPRNYALHKQLLSAEDAHKYLFTPVWEMAELGMTDHDPRWREFDAGTMSEEDKKKYGFLDPRVSKFIRRRSQWAFSIQ